MAEPMTPPSRRESPPPTPPVRSSSNPLQMVIQRLQGECETLRAEKRDVERRLSQEQQKSARVLMEGNELQRRCLVENQKLQSECAHLKEKLREALGTIELLTERLARAEHNERQTHERCTTLSDIIKDLEAEAERSRRTLFHFEQEVDRAKAIAAQATAERDSVLERTEADAKRVRQLWEETLSQHAAQLGAAEEQATKTKRELSRLVKRNKEKTTQLQELEVKLTTALGAAAQETRRAEAVEKELGSAKAEVRHTQEQNARLSESVQAVAQQLESHVTQLRSTERRLHAIAEDAETERRARVAKEAQLDDVLGELDALKSEFVTCLDTHEASMRELRDEMTAQTLSHEKLIAALEAEKKYAASISTMLGGHIGDYNKVLNSVNGKLADMQGRLDEAEPAPRPIHTPRRPTADTSMSIFAH
ncbi:hypothetical protein ACHHYP_03744 [Achlya hypogyna]|uniref:Uncharacterized protein n=1 Tax=Achlya hypogyna TaxID=1202772 RepID=A0A1V9Z316_ACHHY|nr:hypothetical protein ACHHYP_03744 [Achlya hypogyna]